MAQNIKQQNEGQFITLQDILHTKYVMNTYEPNAITTIIKETRYKQKYPETLAIDNCNATHSDYDGSIVQK